MVNSLTSLQLYAKVSFSMRAAYITIPYTLVPKSLMLLLFSHNSYYLIYLCMGYLSTCVYAELGQGYVCSLPIHPKH